jgi:PPM family protein phosphatase
MQLAVSVLSRQGGRPANEDACGCWSGGGITVCVVSDGAGGHGGGDIAAKLVVRQLLTWFSDRPDCSTDAIEQAIVAANEALVAAQREDSEHRDMRATAVVLVVDARQHLASWGNLGDSRLYAFRNGLPIAQTRDHSMLQQMVEAGYVPREALRTSPLRSQLFAALGQPRRAEPYLESAPHRVEPGDAFLLCTDGCWEHIEDAELAGALAVARSPEGWLHALEGLVIARAPSNLDNYSAIALWCEASESSSHGVNAKGLLSSTELEE